MTTLQAQIVDVDGDGGLVMARAVGRLESVADSVEGMLTPEGCAANPFLGERLAYEARVLREIVADIWGQVGAATCERFGHDGDAFSVDELGRMTCIRCTETIANGAVIE